MYTTISDIFYFDDGVNNSFSICISAETEKWKLQVNIISLKEPTACP